MAPQRAFPIDVATQKPSFGGPWRQEGAWQVCWTLLPDKPAARFGRLAQPGFALYSGKSGSTQEQEHTDEIWLVTLVLVLVSQAMLLNTNPQGGYILQYRTTCK